MAPVCTVAYMDKYTCEVEEVLTPSWKTLAAEIHVATAVGMLWHQMSSTEELMVASLVHSPPMSCLHISTSNVTPLAAPQTC